VASSSPWQYAEKAAMPRFARRRKPIGRIKVAALDWSGFLHSYVGPSYAERFFADVLSGFEWLQSGKRVEFELVMWRTSNRAVFLAPRKNRVWHVQPKWNEPAEKLSSIAAGLCATRYAMCKHVYNGRELGDAVVERCELRLRALSYQLPEGLAIGSLLN
jgi:hypothetical protein